MKKIKNYLLNLRDDCYDTSICLKISFLLFGNVFLPALTSSFGFVLNISINSLTYIISQLILIFCYVLIFYNSKKRKEFFIPLIVYLLTILLSVFICNNLYDASVDGWGYHNPAIIKLSEGWNPIYEHFDDKTIGIWSEHYPKVIWLYGASLYKLTNVFFIGYSFNIISTIATLFLMIDIFKHRKISNALAIALSLLITFNTITIGQIFTLYNDGVLGLCILSLLLLYSCIVKKESKLNIISLSIIAFNLSILANIKFNGALYAFLIAAVYSIIMLIKKQLKFDKKLIEYVAFIGVCVGLVACTSYLPNLIHHKNIGYPILGEGKIEIIEQYIPNYVGKTDGNIESFIKSITSASFYEYIYNPFYVASLNDFVCASTSDCRVNGFGPFYQILLILGLTFFVVYVFDVVKKIYSKKTTIKEYISKNGYEYIILLMLAAFFFIAPATWWVRYVPYMFVLPLLLIIFFNKKWDIVNFKTILSYSIIVIYYISLIGIGNSMFKEVRYFTNSVNVEIEYIKNVNSEIIDIAPIDWRTIHNSFRQDMTYKYLDNLNIDYLKHETGECTIIKNLDALAISIVNCSGDSNDN